MKVHYSERLVPGWRKPKSKGCLLLFIGIFISVVSFSQSKRDTITNVIIADTAYKTVRLKTWVTKSKTASITYVDTTTTMTPIKQFVGSQPPANQLPVCNGGGNQSILLPVNSVTLNGSATDADGTITSYTWSKVSGPTTFIIESPSNPSTSITNLITAGSYVFRLTATDNDAGTCTSNVTVTVNAVPPPPDTSGTAYEGFGASATGGSNSTTVVIVTTPAQFTAALGSNKTIKFGADMTLTGTNARVNLSNKSYLTIDGNGYNVTFDNGNNGDCISFDGANCHHIILKGVRTINAGNDGINVIDGAHDIMIDHCSSYENRDGNIDLSANPANVTVQYCFIGGGLNFSGYSGSNLIGYSARNITEHHNLISPVTPGQVGERAPNISDNAAGVFMADFRNNIVWKWGRNGGAGSGYGTAVFNNGRANVVNNYYYSISSPGQATNTDDGYGNAANGKMYAAGNVSGNSGVNPNARSNNAEFPIPAANQVQMQSACDAARKTLLNVGLKTRTAYETTRINDVSLPLCPAQ